MRYLSTSSNEQLIYFRVLDDSADENREQHIVHLQGREITTYSPKLKVSARQELGKYLYHLPDRNISFYCTIRCEKGAFTHAIKLVSNKQFQPDIDGFGSFDQRHFLSGQKLKINAELAQKIASIAETTLASEEEKAIGGEFCAFANAEGLRLYFLD